MLERVFGRSWGTESFHHFLLLRFDHRSLKLFLSRA